MLQRAKSSFKAVMILFLLRLTFEVVAWVLMEIKRNLIIDIPGRVAKALGLRHYESTASVMRKK